MKKKFLCFLIICVMSIVVLTACGGSDSSSSGETQEESKDMLGTYMTAVQQMVEQKISNVEYSNSADDWTYLENDDGTVTVTTKVTTKESSEKQVLTAIFTFSEDSYKGHYLKIGSDVLLDDGTQE